MTKQSLRKIRLHLARNKAHPDGSARHGYEFVAPLGPDAHIDAEVWRATRALCRVRRFWGNEEIDLGHLVRRPGGSWAFRYDIAGDEDDEAGFRFGEHPFVVGEYVSIRDDDGDVNTFQVASVGPL